MCTFSVKITVHDPRVISSVIDPNNKLSAYTIVKNSKTLPLKINLSVLANLNAK